MYVYDYVTKLSYAFFWVIPWCLISRCRGIPRRKHKTFRTQRKFEIKKSELAVSRSHTKLQNHLCQNRARWSITWKT